MGKSALERLNGVKKVENGFLNNKEINRVYYDPDHVTIEKMESVLKRAGTYIGTVK